MKARASRLSLFSVATVAVLGAAAPAHATDYTWLGGAGNWNAANWTAAGFPDAPSSNVFIDGGNLLNSTVTLGSGVSVGTLTIDAGDALGLLDGGMLAVHGGTITNSGTLSLNSSGSAYARLGLAADTTLTGGGQTVLGSSSANSIDSSDGVLRTLTIGSGYTLSGFGGGLGNYYGNLKVINQGTVAVSGGTMTVNVIDNGGVGFNNSAGQVQVANGATLNLASGTLQGGTLQGAGTSVLAGGGTYQNLALLGGFVIPDSGVLRVAGTITNSGTLSLNSSGSAYARLGLAADTTLTGGGQTVLGSSSANSIDSSDGVLRTLTIGSGYTLSGFGGGLGNYYGNLKVINQGTVAVSGGTMTVNVIDNGGVGFNNSAGQVQVANGATLNLASGTLQGGTLQGAGTSVLAGGGTYQNLALLGGFVIPDSGVLRVAGTITNSGTLSLNSSGSAYARLGLAADTTLTGGGQTVLGSSSANSIDSSDGVLRTLTIGSGYTLSGFGGGLGNYYGNLKVINQGTVAVSGGTMTVNVDVTSTGQLTVASGGVLQQTGGSVSAKTITVLPGGSYNLSGGRLEVGRLNGSFVQQGGTFATGIGTSVGTITGNYTLNAGGTLELDLAGLGTNQFDQLSVTGNAALGGYLSIVPQGAFSPPAGAYYNFLHVGGAVSGGFWNAPEGSAIGVGSSTLTLTYLAGTGHDVALVSNLTPGSVNYVAAAPTQVAYVAGTYDGSAASATLSYQGLDVLSGSSFTLGPFETLNLDGGNGILTIGEGAVFTGDGVILGSVVNRGLVRIPILLLPQVSGGYVQIELVPVLSPAQPVVLPQETVVSIGTFNGENPGGVGGSGGSGGGGGGGCSGCAGGGTAAGGGTFTQWVKVDGSVQTPATLRTKASLEVTGPYTQTSTGALRLFVGGNHAADPGPAKTGGSYSQLFVDNQVTLDGALQIVLQPESFHSFSYTPHVGDTFDFVVGTAPISEAPTLHYQVFVDAAGVGMLGGLTLSPYNSGIASDPDKLFLVNEQVFTFALVEGGTVLRATLIAPLTVNAIVDSDGDGIADAIDNCTRVANPDQRDTDADGYGNPCDPDLDNNGVVNISDFNRLKARLGITPVVDVDADLDGNGAVNINDLNRLKSFLGKAPGTSARRAVAPDSSMGFTVTGNVGGLTGTGLVLQNNGAETLAVPGLGAFVFPSALPSGTNYAVTVLTQPSGQTCSVTAGSGTVGIGSLPNVVVTCTSP